MSNDELCRLEEWCINEFEHGSRVKAGKIYKVYCKYLKLTYPKTDISELQI